MGGRPRFNRWSLSRSQEERKKGSLTNQVYSRQRFNRKSLSGRLEGERERESKRKRSFNSKVGGRQRFNKWSLSGGEEGNWK